MRMAITMDLPLSYRHTELEVIFRGLRAGDSCSVVGASGMAKSNLFRHMLSAEVREHYLGENYRQYLFVAVDANEAHELSERAISDLVLDRLADACQGDSPIHHAKNDFRSLAGSDDQKTRVLARGVKAVLDGSSAQLVFLFDQFDAVYKGLDGRFFANLRAIRDQYKYRVSYLIFTREHLGKLRNSHEHEEFEELFSVNVIGLGPYSRNDASLLIERVSGRYGATLPRPTSEQLIALTGGHPGMLRAASIALIKREFELPRGEADALDTLLRCADVRLECDKLWTSISAEEQDCLRVLSSATAASHQQTESRRFLISKGLIRIDKEKSDIFSPLFNDYIATSRLAAPAATRISADPFRIDSAGDVWVNGERVTPPLSRKELLLLEYLCLEPGRLRTKDEIIAIVYPDEYKSGESISDDALNALFKRLRERLEPYGNSGSRIVTLRGKGYRLDISRKI